MNVSGKWQEGGFEGEVRLAPVAEPEAVERVPVSAATYGELAAQVAQALGGEAAVTADEVLARYLKEHLGTEAFVVEKTESFQAGDGPARTYPLPYLRFLKAAEPKREPAQAPQLPVWQG